MTLDPRGARYDFYKLAESERTRFRERDFSRVRAQRANDEGITEGRRQGVLSGIRARVRPTHRGIMHAPANQVGPHELTESVCRHADGTLGRIAIVRQANEAWVAVCVTA